MNIQVEIISKQLIKPSSPTPDHLRHYQLSFLDQIQPQYFMPLFLFYSKNPNTNNNFETCNLLKQSLSQVLAIFYPLAGRLKNNSYVDCNDEGFLFVVAKTNCQLSHILRDRNPNNNNYFAPTQPDEADELTGFCQITFFSCGGLALSFPMLHKLGDAVSHYLFLNTWAAMARGDTDIQIPSFGAAANCLPNRNLSGFEQSVMLTYKEKIITKVFVFDASAIEGLRDKYTTSDGTRPSRVDALAAFIWSRFMAVTQGEEAKNKQYALNQVVNLRSRMKPPLSKLSFGNLTWMTVAEADMKAKSDECCGIVKRMEDSKRDVYADCVKKLQNSHEFQNFLNKLLDFPFRFNFSSLCNLGAYEADFGWGRPSWVGFAPLVTENTVLFYDTREGKGIEAWIGLKEEDMAKFEIDKNLLAHVSSSTANGNPIHAQPRL